jgi:tRNA dimethylallyltransferase
VRVSAIVAIVGPTAVGKTDLSLELAARFPVEIVNADSRQVYRYMDIGTGKPTAAEQALAPHHLIDVVEPDEPFSLSTYRELAARAVAGIRTRGRLPLLVGGTGQYVWSLLEDWDVPRVPPDAAFRGEMEEVARREGPAALHARLARLDPEAAARIQATNVRRVVRALELHRATGELPSRVLWRRGEGIEALVIGLAMDRHELVARADIRIDRMVHEGFADEVRSLLGRGYTAGLPAMSSIGYREMIAFVEGRVSLDETVAAIRRETRRLMRRQRAWFRADDVRINWLDSGRPVETLGRAVSLIQGEAG